MGPEDDEAPKTAYKVFRDKKIDKTDIWGEGGFGIWAKKPVLSMGAGANPERCLYPNENKCEDEDLQEFCAFFFNRWTFIYKVQGKLINYIERLAITFNGTCATDYRENGFFTLALRRDDANEKDELTSNVPQNIVWSQGNNIQVGNF